MVDATSNANLALAYAADAIGVDGRCSHLAVFCLALRFLRLCLSCGEALVGVLVAQRLLRAESR